jgi:hypothetical protein
MFPTIAQYNQVIQAQGSNAFRTLSSLSFVPSRTLPIKIFSYGSGSYAVVFKAKDHLNQYAIRCFISAEAENIERYRSISQHLNKIHSSWVCKVELLEREINVAGSYYPLIKMDWVEGKLLNAFITEVLHSNEALSALQREIITISSSLEENQVGHGDIQCGNIIVQNGPGNQPVIKLIDYDGMYVPSFSHKTNLERGRSEFQHPQRSLMPYNEKIDRFSFWVIICALEAIKFDKTLWLEKMQGGFNTLDNVLFEGSDFLAFHSSKLVSRLYQLNQPSLSFYLNQLGKFCYSSSNIVEAPVLFNSATVQIQNPNISFPTSNPSEEIELISYPAGASVLNSFFQRIGTTPLTINKSTFINKSLIISYGNETKRIDIGKQDSKIELTFNPVVTHLNSRNNTTDVILSESLPSTSLANSSDKNDNASHESSLTEKYIWVAIILFIVIFGAIVFVETKSDNSTTAGVNATESGNGYIAAVDSVDSMGRSVDTVSTMVPNSYDTTATITVDTTGSIDDNYTTETSLNTSSTENLEDDHGNTALDVINKFFDALNRNNPRDAWYHTYNPIWEEKGIEWFISTEAYGGVTKVYMEKKYMVSGSTTEPIVHVEYYAEDTYNGNKCLRQDITLKKVALNGVPERWMIVNVYNTVPPYECELVDE